MLPGYNHNIRYKDKVFHVQTEDNGLNDPDLVTQVFLGGQFVAIERSSYGSILVVLLDDKARDLPIKQLRQDHPNRQLKNLVLRQYDARIDAYLVAARAHAASAADPMAASLGSSPIP